MTFDDFLGIQIESEFKQELKDQAQEKGLKTSSYARMKLKETV